MQPQKDEDKPELIYKDQQCHRGGYTAKNGGKKPEEKQRCGAVNKKE